MTKRSSSFSDLFVVPLRIVLRHKSFCQGWGSLRLWVGVGLLPPRYYKSREGPGRLGQAGLGQARADLQTFRLSSCRTQTLLCPEIL